VLKTLWPYLWPKGAPGLRVRVIVALAAILVAKVLNVWVPIFYKRAVDALSVEGDAKLVLPTMAIVAYGLARIGALGFNQLRDAVFEKVAQRAMRTAAVRVFSHLHGLSLRFHLERQTGGLARAVERGTSAISSLLGIALFNVLPTAFELVLVLVVLLRNFDASFALVTGLTVVGYVAFTVWTTEWRLAFRRQMNDADSKANTRAIDSLLNYETVKYFGNERLETEAYDAALSKYERAAIKSQSSLSLLNLGQAAIVATGVTTLMFMAASGILAGDLTVGDFVLVNTYLIQLAQPLNIFGWVYRSVKQSLVNMEHMFSLLDQRPDIDDPDDARALGPGPREVRFESVSFGYDARRPVLHEVSFEIPPGKRVALVGPSGGGKSTIARLLFRFYDPTSGRITIDGHDLKDLSVASLRRAIGIVPQDTVLFNDTLEYNLSYARPTATHDEIEAAARAARIHEFIRATPDGYDTVVGERGLKLSGGEKQRVAIARVFLKSPSILILDEATSALDSATEREIQSEMWAASEGRTTLIIAHRLSTVVDADEILVLVDGRIRERGRHDDLLGQGGLYWSMWQQQQSEQERVVP
jgi:ATP-binding cassette subfamily B protein